MSNYAADAYSKLSQRYKRNSGYSTGGWTGPGSKYIPRKDDPMTTAPDCNAFGHDPEVEAQIKRFNEWRKTHPAPDVSDPIANLKAANDYGHREGNTVDTTPDYQATLAGWWENAEQGEAAPGDWIITHSDDDTTPGYIVEQAPAYPLSRKHQPYRILARAPKPTPAWHNAVAVIAHTDDEDTRRAFVRNGARTSWADIEGYYHADRLIDPVPLIPAKVDGVMIEWARRELNKAGWAVEGWVIAAVLTAALGIGDK